MYGKSIDIYRSPIMAILKKRISALFFQVTILSHQKCPTKLLCQVKYLLNDTVIVLLITVSCKWFQTNTVLGTLHHIVIHKFHMMAKFMA